MDLSSSLGCIVFLWMHISLVNMSLTEGFTPYSQKLVGVTLVPVMHQFPFDILKGLGNGRLAFAFPFRFGICIGFLVPDIGYARNGCGVVSGLVCSDKCLDWSMRGIVRAPLCDISMLDEEHDCSVHQHNVMSVAGCVLICEAGGYGGLLSPSSHVARVRGAMDVEEVGVGPPLGSRLKSPANMAGPEFQ